MPVFAKLAHANERVVVFIDGANLYSTAKSLQFDIDYQKLRNEFDSLGQFVRATYYTALIDNDELSPLRPLVDWLDYNGYGVATKPAKEYTDFDGRRRYKGDMKVDIAVDMLEAAETADHLVLFSGDGDFYPVIEAIRRKSVRVSVVSTIQTSPPMVSDDLRRIADNFMDIADIAPAITRAARTGERVVRDRRA